MAKRKALAKEAARQGRCLAMSEYKVYLMLSKILS